MRGRVWGAVALTLGLGACGGIQINTDYNPEIDFTAYRTFDWAEGSGGGADGVVTELVDQRFRRSVEAELASRGMERVTSGQPDVFIGYQVTLDDRVDYQTVNTYYGGAYGYRGVYGGAAGTRTTAREYTIGTLVIDLFDARQRELVWRATGEGKVNEQQQTPEESQERINQVVAQILEDFPIGS